MDCSLPNSSVHVDSPGKNTLEGCHALVQEIFPTQRSNPGLPHCRQILYHLNYHGSPGIIEWVAYPFPRGSSWPQNQMGVSCIAGRFFSSWATREAYRKQQLKVEGFFFLVCLFLSCHFKDKEHKRSAFIFFLLILLDRPFLQCRQPSSLH